MAAVLDFVPGFIYNFEGDIKPAEAVLAEKVPSEAAADFIQHYRQLYELVSGALPSEEGSSEEISVSDIIEIYSSICDDFQRLENEGGLGASDKSGYIINGIMTCLKADFENEILMIENPEEGFAKAYKDFLEKNAGFLVVSGKNRLKKTLQRLEAVSLYMTANCPEYARLVEISGFIGTLGGEKENYMKAAESLSDAAAAYIESRKPVPMGETGKDRLSIAKELRDICGALKRNLAIDIAMDEAAASARPASERLAEKIQNALEALEAAWNTKDLFVLRNSVSELVYFDGVEKKLSSENPDTLEDMISSARIKASLKQINKLTTIIVAKFDLLGFSEAIDDGTLRKYVVSNFSRLAPAAVAELNAAKA